MSVVKASFKCRSTCKIRFNQAFRSNFQGDKGRHSMEADVVHGFEKLVLTYETVQFMEGIKKGSSRKSVMVFHDESVGEPIWARVCAS